ncbi:MAG: hypothetical protein IJY15_06755, partial [Thermoguttaceae bacterium]|nr:hypothetical protein [Thermoguttaceae bacterium]
PLLLAVDFRIGDKIFLVQYAVGGIGGLLGAARVKARKKKKESESAEQTVAQSEKKPSKTKEIAIYALGLFCFAAAGDCGVKVERLAEQVSHRLTQKRIFNKNLEAFRNAFESGAYDEAFEFACACEEAGRDWPDNEMFLSDAHFMKAEAAEMTGDYDVASACYAAYKAGRPDINRGSVITSGPRLAYKQGKTDEAFRGYCELFAAGTAASEPARLNRLRFPKTAASTILLLDYAEKDRVLSPFAEYADFLTFVETEFKAQDEPEKYAETMEFFRSCAADASNAADENVQTDDSESDVEGAKTPTKASPK